MKALSVRQPWAWAILHAGKRIENRSWDRQPGLRAFRGRVLLHASGGLTHREYRDGHACITDAAPGVGVPPMEDLPQGAVVGVMTIVDCVRIEEDEWGQVQNAEALRPQDVTWAWGPWGLVLEDVVALATPVPCMGRLGFWKAPDAVVEAVSTLVGVAGQVIR